MLKIEQGFGFLSPKTIFNFFQWVPNMNAVKIGLGASLGAFHFL